MMEVMWSILCSLAAMGLGRCILNKRERTPSTAWAHAWCIGWLVWGLTGLVLASLGAWNVVTAKSMMYLSLLGWIHDIPKPRPSAKLWVIPLIALALGPGFVDAIGPVLGADEQYLHIGLPLQMFQHGELLGGPLHPNGSRPLTLQLVYGVAVAQGTNNSAAIMHWIHSLGLVVLMLQCAQSHLGSMKVGALAATVFIASTTVQMASGQAGSDVPAAFAVLVAMDAALRAQPKMLGLAAGLAMSIKYTVAAPLLGIFLVSRMSMRHRTIAGMLAMLTVAPWWGRNLLEGLHPLFPFAGWPEPALPFQYLEKYGAGREWLDFLLLPWRATFDSELHNFRFLGRIHPFFFLMLLPAPLAMRRRAIRPWLLASTVGAIGWAVGPHWLRYLMPTLPLLALAGAAATIAVLQTRWQQSLLVVGWLAASVYGLRDLPAQTKASFAALDKAPFRMGSEAYAFCNDHLPPDATVALLFDWESTEIHRKQILGSIEDHVPTRHFLLRHPGREVSTLVAEGATHAVVRTPMFLPKTYPFLNEETLQQDFLVPVSNLQDSLLMNASLVFRSRTHAVYRLPDTP